jgi:hypothetical protein
MYDGGSPGAISVQQGYVYWADNFLDLGTGKATILRVPTNAPPVTGPTSVEQLKVATSAATSILEFHAMAGGLYYVVQAFRDKSTDPTSFIERLDLANSTTTRVVGGFPLGWGMSDDRQNLYWIDTTGTTFEVRKFDTRSPPDAGSTVINNVDTQGPYATVWAEGQLYWSEDACKLNPTACQVVACAATPSSNTCTTPRTVIPQTGAVTALVANDTVLFAGGGSGGIFQYAMRAGGVLTTIPNPAGSTENEPSVESMAVDARDLYWVSSSYSTDIGAIHGCRLSTAGDVVAQCQNPYVIQDNLNFPGGIALDDTAVYFSVHGAGAIYRLAR